ncbi:MAG TPA: GNAT family N-acetyltransferase [Gemmatimonadota bacterium]|nr:GNAT family N-acetyltransferase [Gemmatimonadota bacterium]
MVASVMTLEREHVTDVVAVLAEAFHEYPVMRYVLGASDDYAARLDRLVTFFVMARVLRGEALLGIAGADGLGAAALVSRPDGESPSELDALRERTWVVLGDDARHRYENFGHATALTAVMDPHIHLNMIGTRRAVRGLGMGRLLLDAVHGMSERDETSMGVSLTTEVAQNLALYEHFGYEIVGSSEVGSAFTTWTMFRRNAAR